MVTQIAHCGRMPLNLKQMMIGIALMVCENDNGGLQNERGTSDGIVTGIEGDA